MPSPNNITELIIFVGGAIVAVLVLMVGSRYTRFGKKLTGDWRPGPVEIDASQVRAERPRQKHVDPLAQVKLIYVIPPLLVLMALAFVFYFVTRQTFQVGN